MVAPEIAKRLECGEFSPLFFSFLQTESGENVHSICFRAPGK
jgi:hypothetical protein